jgi:hypothetical protein
MGIVVNEKLASETPCECVQIGPTTERHDLLCHSKGVIGTLSDTQELEFCNPKEITKPDGRVERIEKFRQAAKICSEEIKDLPKGERGEPFRLCIGRELEKAGIEI